MDTRDSGLGRGVGALMDPTAAQILDMLMATESGIAYPEFQLAAGIIDLFVVDEHSMRGYEVKAATDRVTDRRFQWQFDQYRQRCEQLTYVVAPKFVEHCMEHLPEWVGVMGVYDDYLVVEREPQMNPDTTTYELMRMLWKPEAVRKARELGIYAGHTYRCPDCYWGESGKHDLSSRKCGSGLGRMLAAHMTEEDARLYVRHSIMQRAWAVGLEGKSRRRFALPYVPRGDE